MAFCYTIPASRDFCGYFHEGQRSNACLKGPMRTRNFVVLACSILIWLCAAKSGFAQTKLLRYPDVHGDRVVFTYGGDLWTASASGGLATRLTSHPGLELFARFSPDGNWTAFTGQYDGDEQVYVIPATGGVPR